MESLPEPLTALFSELLEQARLFDRSAGTEGTLPGSFVAKTVGGRRYLYWQISKGGARWQRYLGADTPELRSAIDAVTSRRDELEADRASLARLGSMLIEGGASAEEPALLAVLSLFADLGLFRRGAVLVGTAAYRLYGNLLGVYLPTASTSREGIDAVPSIDVAVSADVERRPPIESGLAGLGYLPVPGVDAKRPSTSFKIRRQELRVEFLTPARTPQVRGTVEIPGLGLAARPLPFLEYLIEEPVPAVALGRSPTLVRVPQPARFALHKLWTASQRPASERAKARRDRAQAGALLEVLGERYPSELEAAREALADRRRELGLARE